MQQMASEATSKRGCLGEILLLIRILSAGLGSVLTLGGCLLGTGWVVALARGASAAELPDPIAMMYPILMLPTGLVLLLVSGLLFATSRWRRR